MLAQRWPTSATLASVVPALARCLLQAVIFISREDSTDQIQGRRV